MAKLTLNDLVNFENQQSAASLINDNNAATEAALELTLTRTGTSPNSMEADLDMNSNRILNLPEALDSNEPIRLGDIDDFLPAIYVQDSEPSTAPSVSIEGSIWIDSDSADNDLYQLVDEVWVDTTVNVIGATGAAGDTGATGASQEIFVQNDAPATTGIDGNLWVDANSADLDLFILSSAAWVDTGVNLKGDTGATGAAGTAATIAVGTVDTVAFGNPATVTNVGTAEAAIFDFEIPAGQDGAGSGNVNTFGAPVVDERIVMYDGTSGDSIQDSGILVTNVVTPSSTHTLTNKTFDANGTGNSLSNVETADIAAGSKTGADPDLVTGTAGTNGNLSMWNTDGDLVDASVVAANVLVDADIGAAVQAFDTGLSDIAGLAVTDGNIIVGDGANWVAESGATARTSLGLAIGTDVQAFDADTLKADTADVLTAGFATTVFNAGTQSGAGTYTPNEANGNFQRAVNGGAHTFAPPTNDSNIVVQYTNNASAGTITTSGWTIVTGDDLTTTDGHDFIFYCTKINGFSHLNIVALQ